MEKRTRVLVQFLYFTACVGLLIGAVRFLSGDMLNAAFVRLFDAPAAAAQIASSEPVSERIENQTQPPTLPGVLQTGKTGQSDYQTPTDVLVMEEDYLAAFALQDTDGSVLSDDFSDAGVTLWVQNAAVRNSTSSKNPDFDLLLEQGAHLSIAEPSEPLVLIYHTHTSESYLLSDNGVFWNDYDTHTEQSDRNMIRVGDVLAQTLELNGIGVIHDKTVYDEGYNGAYARSREGILTILEQYPSIQIVLDVHRDAFYYSDNSRGKPVVEIDGKKAAQIMIISGAEEGQIANFPDWEYNLRFALELQNTASTLFGGLMRPLYFCQRKYNMDVAPNALLLEIGSDANTLEEALYSAHLCGIALTKVIENHLD